MIHIGRLSLLLIKPQRLDPCVVCGQPWKSELQCERCGAPIHGSCYWNGLSPAELKLSGDLIFGTPDSQPGDYPVICSGCRS